MFRTDRPILRVARAGLAAVMLMACSMGGCECRWKREPQGPAESIGRAVDEAVEGVKDASKKDTVKIEIKDD